MITATELVLRIQSKLLIEDIEKLRLSKIRSKIDRRLKQFKSFKTKSNDHWFSELCFCILTANSKAKTAINIQKELGCIGFQRNDQKSIRNCILKNKHRFHNNKSKFIVEARKFLDIKKIIQKKVKEEGQKKARDWIAKNVKGIGIKEASHFMRNVGYFDLAILDRHIINLFTEYNIIKEKPKSITPKTYYRLEKVFLMIAKDLNMSSAELDLYMWYLKTGEVLK